MAVTHARCTEITSEIEFVACADDHWAQLVAMLSVRSSRIRICSSFIDDAQVADQSIKRFLVEALRVPTTVTIVVGLNQPRKPSFESTKFLVDMAKRGASIFRCPNLHARVAIVEPMPEDAARGVPARALITSSSFSGAFVNTIQHNFHDAGVATSRKEVVARALTFVNHVLDNSRPWEPDDQLD